MQSIPFERFQFFRVPLFRRENVTNYHISLFRRGENGERGRSAPHMALWLSHMQCLLPAGSLMIINIGNIVNILNNVNIVNRVNGAKRVNILAVTLALFVVSRFVDKCQHCQHCYQTLYILL